jgi:hypothetical protein
MPSQMPSDIVGVWKLLSIQVEFADTGERADVYGPNPVGYLILTESGRMIALVTAGDRTPPQSQADTAALFDTMMAYTGPCRIEGDKFITNADVAWHPSWSGTDQPRFFQLDGDLLSITTPQQTHPRYGGRPLRGILSWRRDS